jgi:hypothetical protein
VLVDLASRLLAAMKNIMLLLIITCLGFAVAEDAVKTVTSGVIESCSG